MSDVKTTLVVKRHPDGYNYVPFDYDPHPSRQGIVDAYLAALVREGHVLTHVKGETEEDGFHVKLVSGPRS